MQKGLKSLFNRDNFFGKVDFEGSDSNLIKTHTYSSLLIAFVHIALDLHVESIKTDSIYFKHLLNAGVWTKLKIEDQKKKGKENNSPYE